MRKFRQLQFLVNDLVACFKIINNYQCLIAYTVLLQLHLLRINAEKIISAEKNDYE